MAVFVLEDLQRLDRGDGLPARRMIEHGHKLADDAIVCVKGRVDKRDETGRSSCAMDIDGVRAASTTAPRRCGSSCPPTSLDEERIDQLKGILREHPGDSPVFLHLGERQVLRLPDEFRVDLDRRRRRAAGAPSATTPCALARRVAALGRRSRRDALASSGGATEVRPDACGAKPTEHPGAATAWRSRSRPRTARRSPTPSSTRWPTSVPMGRRVRDRVLSKARRTGC